MLSDNPLSTWIVYIVLEPSSAVTITWTSSPSCGFTFPSGWPTITAVAPGAGVTTIVTSSSSGSDV